MTSDSSAVSQDMILFEMATQQVSTQTQTKTQTKSKAEKYRDKPKESMTSVILSPLRSPLAMQILSVSFPLLVPVLCVHQSRFFPYILLWSSQFVLSAPSDSNFCVCVLVLVSVLLPVLVQGLSQNLFFANSNSVLLLFYCLWAFVFLSLFSLLLLILVLLCFGQMIILESVRQFLFFV